MHEPKIKVSIYFCKENYRLTKRSRTKEKSKMFLETIHKYTIIHKIL